MHSAEPKRRRLRLAVITDSISHFEVPLFRLCASSSDLLFKVFYLQTVKEQVFDSEYTQSIDWGVNLLAGYDSMQVESAEDFTSAADAWRADVVLIYGYGWPGAPRVILRNWLRGRPQVHRGTLNFYLDPRRPIKGRLMRPFGRMLLNLFDAHHYGGDYSRKVLLDAGAKESSIFFVPYSVDTAYFLAEAANPEQRKLAMDIRNRLGWSIDDHVILFIAQHNWFKGPDIALEVFRQIAHTDSKARFLVVGSGRMTDDLKVYAQEHLGQGQVHFAGFVPSAKTVAYYLASDLVLCTSRYETWARMVNEAMLCSRPCVVSRVVPAAGGLIVNNDNGYVVDEPKASLFVPAVLRYFALPLDKRQQMGNAACQKAQFFAYEPHIGNVVAAARYACSHAKQSTWRN